MTQAIIFTNDNGGVSVCIPTGELPIEEVLAKDCPEGAIIVDADSLPTDNEFFNAWELTDGKVTVNLEKARAFKLKQFNAAAVEKAQKRQLNTLAAIENETSDEAFTTSLASGRASIAAATTTAELAAI